MRSSSGAGMAFPHVRRRMRAPRTGESTSRVVIAERVFCADRGPRAVPTTGRRAVRCQLVNFVEHDHRVLGAASFRRGTIAGKRADVGARWPRISASSWSRPRDAGRTCGRARGRPTRQRRLADARVRPAWMIAPDPPPRTVMPRSLRSLRTARNSMMRCFTSSSPCGLIKVAVPRRGRGCRRSDIPGDPNIQSRYVLIQPCPGSARWSARSARVALNLGADVFGMPALSRRAR